jgi:hypothetical protein
MERAYMHPAEPPSLEHDIWGAPHPKAAVAGALGPNRRIRPMSANGLSADP